MIVIQDEDTLEKSVFSSQDWVHENFLEVNKVFCSQTMSPDFLKRP